jgi:outer membrane protein assembly factor BamD
MKSLLQILLFLLMGYIAGCSSSTKTITEEIKIKEPELMYSDALNEFESKNYDKAIEKFHRIELNFPLSKEAIQSQIMIAFIEYIKMEYDLALIKLEKIIKRYPSYKDIDYVYYLKAMCYYERIENPELDGRFNTLALQSFKETINYFPKSKYARDSQQKIILLKENHAAKHMDVGMFYLKQKKYLAALKRYQKVINEHSQSKYTPEALHRLVEIYYSLGMIEDSKKTASVLGYNYPKSKWYQYSYNLVGDQNSNESKKINIFKRIINKISSNNEK